MEIDQLLSFAVAAETLNFSTAGQRLGRVQSAISTQIAKLEETTGQSLFKRGRGKPMTLTPAGERLLVYAQKMLRLNAEALRSLQPDRPRKTMRFGTTETYALTVLPRTLSLFASLCPDMDIEVLCARSPELLHALDASELDLVLVTEQGRLDCRALIREEPLTWVASPRFQFASNVPLPLAFMPGGCEFRHAGLKALDEADRNWRLVMTSPSPTGVRAALHAGIAATVMPRISIDGTLRMLGDREGLPALGTISMVAHWQASESDPVIQAFIEQISCVI